jgi:CHAT domain-containing protein/tetratricopeptide (TPR) repeat protein
MLFPSLVLSVTISAGVPGDKIRPGETLRGSLAAGDSVLEGHGPSKRFVLEAAKDGPLTVSLDSHDFDAFLRIETEVGEKIVEADEGGIETNARAVFEAKAGARYRVIAGAAKEGGGELSLSVRAGEGPLPKGMALVEAAAAFRAKAAERAVERGDSKLAARHRLREGESFLDTDLRRAMTAFDASLSLAREAGDRTGEANALASIANCHHTLGDFPRARELHEQALEIAREIRDRFTEAKVLVNLGRAHEALADLPRARECYEAALEVARGVANPVFECQVRQFLGQLLVSLSDFTRAREHLEESLSLARKAKVRRLEVQSLGMLGTYHASRGVHERAIEHYEGALEIARNDGFRSSVASTLGNLATAHYYRGELARARDLYEESLVIARQVGNRPVELNALGNLGNVYTSLGEYRKAVARYESCIEHYRQLEDQDGIAVFTANLGTVLINLGEYPSAIERLDEALGLFRGIGSRRGEGGVLSSLGMARSELGDHRGARDLHEMALAIARETSDRRAEAAALGNLAVMHDRLGDLPRSRELQEKRLAICRELKDREGEATALGNLGALFNDLGRDAEAIEHHEKALALAREIESRALEAHALGNLAVCRKRGGELEEARRLAVSAHAIFVELGHEEDALHPLETLARIAVEQRRTPEARQALREAAELLDRAAGGGLETSDAAGLRSRHANWEAIAHALTALRLEEAGDDARKRSGILREGFRDASRWKGRALLEGIAEHRQGGRTAEAIRIRRERQDVLARREKVLERTSEAVRSGKPPAEVDALRREAAALLEEAGAVAARLREASPTDAELDAPSGADPEAVRRAAVEDDTLLIEYAPGEKQLFAYVLGARGLDFLELGEWSELQKHAEFVEALSSSPPPGTVEDFARSGKALHDALLAPALRKAGEGIRKLVIVPTPAVTQMPFEALVVAVKAEQPRTFQDLDFVLDRYEVSYAPSSAVLVEIARAGARQPGKALVLADPLYPSEAERSSPLTFASLRGVPAPRDFRRIPKTRSEALAIARLLATEEGDDVLKRLTALSRGRSFSFSSGRLDLHLGAEASPERLAGDLKGYEVLHLAAHGYVDLEHPQRTGIGLAFGPDGGGYFTLSDVLDLDLDARLVVLSACETAAGQVRKGEGVESLAMAFLHAGARGVVASLWQVSDRAAAETMRGFYRALRAGGASRALREAKLSLRRSASRGTAKKSGPIDMSHPFYWAPFVHVGLP